MTAPRPWSAYPAWALRVLADTEPSKAADTLSATKAARGIQHSRNEAGDCTAETISRWLRSGSRLVDLSDPMVIAHLTTIGGTPRFHVLTTEEEGPVFILTNLGEGLKVSLGGVAQHFSGSPLGHSAKELVERLSFAWNKGWSDGFDGLSPTIAVQATPEGPRVTYWMPLTDPQPGEAQWVNALGASGCWEILRWHNLTHEARTEEESEEPGILTLFSVFLGLAINAVAALTESREVVRVRRRRPRQKGVRGARQRNALRPEVYTLDVHALSSWVERVERQEGPDAPRRSPASTDGTRTVRLHTCREHQRRTWVVSPKPGEVVVDTRPGKLRKDGSRATLSCVLRRVQAHARGVGVEPRPIVLRSQA